MRNIEKLRNYFLGKDPQLQETMADNSLRLIGIEGKHFVLRIEMLRKLEALKKELTDEDEELQRLIDNLERALDDLELKHERDIAAVEEDIGAEESARILADNALSGRIDTNAGDIAALTFWKNTTDFVLASDLATALLDYYTKDEVDQLISVIPTFDIQVVQTLPAEGDSRVLYLAPSQDPGTSNVYDEFIWIIPTGELIGQWEKIGSTAVDMSNYYTKGETDTLLNAKQGTLTAGSNIQINGSTISATDTTYSDATQSASGLMSSTDKTKLDGIDVGAQVNDIETISVNGTAQTITNKNVDITVPSYTAGDYIDITNNEISVTGIVPNGSARTPLTLTTGQYYYCYDFDENVTLTTEANSGYYKVDNNTNEKQDYVFQFSSAIGNGKFVAFTMNSNGRSVEDMVLTTPFALKNTTGATKYYEDIGFGVTLNPGESFVISCESTDQYTPSAYLMNFANQEALQPITWHYFTCVDGEPITISSTQEYPYEYFVYENTGKAGVFGFKINSWSSDIPTFAITDNNDIVLGFSLSGLGWSGEYARMIGVYLNSGEKLYVNALVDDYTPSVTVYSEDTAVLDEYTKFTDTFVGTDGTSSGKAGVVPAPTSNDANKYLKSDGTWGTVSAGSSDYDDLTDKPQINGVTLSGNKTSADLDLDMVILSYGNSTWQEFLDAYRRNAVVYCRASSAADPSSGSQTRLAFMAYINNATNPTEVEFQYYRSVSTKTASQQGDQVIVYKLTSAGAWTVATRENGSKVVAGTNMTSTYSNGVLTLNATGGSGEMNVIDSISVNGVAQTPDANKNVDLTVPTITYGTTDLTPGTSTLNDGEFYFVYE